MLTPHTQAGTTVMIDGHHVTMVDNLGSRGPLVMDLDRAELTEGLCTIYDRTLDTAVLAGDGSATRFGDLVDVAVRQIMYGTEARKRCASLDIFIARER